MQICDLHCDLLSYMAKGGDYRNREVRCSLPQLQAGSVAFQVMAVFTETGEGSVASANLQFASFERLLSLDVFEEWSGSLLENKIAIIPAIENLSGLCEEEEPLEGLFERLNRPVLYVSLTWQTENRFGGGNHTKVGLKRDGELFLEYISGKKVAIDLSHTSDHLAHDILDYIDKKGLHITPIASHSNMRAVHKDDRNLPDNLVSEVIKRGGIIGLNLVRKFLGGRPPEGFMAHFDHMKHLGGERHVCLGADFFFEGTIVPTLHHVLPFYYTGFGEASCYPQLLAQMGEEARKNIAHANFEAFVQREGLYAASG